MLDELEAADGRLETAAAVRRRRLGGRPVRSVELVLACSFQDIVLVDLAVAVDPVIEVVFLDTGSHFPETLRLRRRGRRALLTSTSR